MVSRMEHIEYDSSGEMRCNVVKRMLSALYYTSCESNYCHKYFPIEIGI